MSDHQAAYPIATMCELLGVSSSGYYAWIKRRPSQRAETDAVLIAEIVPHMKPRAAPTVHRAFKPSLPPKAFALAASGSRD